MIYLDNAATTLKKPQIVYDTLYNYTVKHGANALRGNYAQSLVSSNVIVEAQDTVAELFNIEKSSNIVFTQNATYALNTAILGTLKKADHAIISQMEHNSVIRPVHALCNYTVAEADEEEALVANKEENQAVKWFTFEEALRASKETWFVENVYPKLIAKSEQNL